MLIKRLREILDEAREKEQCIEPFSVRQLVVGKMVELPEAIPHLPMSLEEFREQVIRTMAERVDRQMLGDDPPSGHK